MNRTDLNLLYTLDVLLKVKSTTLAAKELSTSQSAVSRSLTKMREAMGDQLLVRKGQSLELTARGEQLSRDLPQLMSQMEHLFSGDSFDAASSNAQVTIAMNASIAEWIVPGFVRHLSVEAPNIELTIDDWGASTPDQLARGKVRMGINYFPLDLPKSFIQRKVGQDDFVLVCRADHPLHKEPHITLEHIREYPFAVHIMKDWNDVTPRAEAELNRHGVHRNVKLRCRHLSIILRALQESDMVLFCPRLTAAQFDKRFIAIPFSEEYQQPSGDIGLFYSNHFTSDPLTLWLEEALRKVIKQVTRTPARPGEWQSL